MVGAFQRHEAAGCRAARKISLALAMPTVLSVGEMHDEQLGGAVCEPICRVCPVDGHWADRPVTASHATRSGRDEEEVPGRDEEKTRTPVASMSSEPASVLVAKPIWLRSVACRKDVAVSVSAADNVHRCTQRGHKTRGDR
jgi:hypothetical protein